MKKILLFLSVIFMYLHANGQQTFQLAITGGGSDVGRAIIKTADGGYAITGSAYPVADSSDVYVIKLSSTGVIQWTQTYGGPNYDVGASIIQTSDHGYAITGRTGYWNFDTYTIKLDSNGVLQWTNKVNNNGFDSQGYSIIQANDGGYIISGRADDQIGLTNAYIIKLNSSGILQWTKSLTGFNDGGYCIIKTNDNGYAISGFAGTANLNLYIVKTDSSFNVQWSRTIGGSGQEVCFPATKFIQTADGGYAMTGSTTSFGAGSNDVYVVKLGSTGNLQWTRTIGGTGDDNGRSIIQTADKSYVIAGTTNSFGAGGYDDYVIKLDSSGVLQWTRAIGGSVDESANSLIKSDDGGYVIAGSTTTYGFGGAVYIVKLNSSGNTCGNMVTAAGTASTGGTAANGTSTSSLYNGTASSWGINKGSIGTLSTVCNCSPPTASITPSGSTIFCAGGSVILNANTGAGLTYQWKKNGTNISGATNQNYTATTSGSYTVVVTNACGTATSTTVAVTVNAIPVATISGSTTICSGQSVLLIVTFTGGPGPYTFTYNPGGIIVNTASNPYSILVAPTVTTVYTLSAVANATCAGTVNGSATVTVNPLPSAIITPAGSTTFCSGGSVLLNAQVAANRTYQWKKAGVNISGATLSSYTATIGGSYKVTVTNTTTGCSKTTVSATVVAVNALPSATISPQGPTTFCAGGSVVLKANSGTGLTYQWKKGGTNISGATFLNYSATTAGVYKVKVTNSNGCGKLSTGVTVSVPCREGESVKMGGGESRIDVSVFPNPAHSEINIVLSSTNEYEIEIVNTLGERIIKEKNRNSIDISKLTGGIYFIKIVQGNNFFTQKFIKQ